MRRVGMLLSLVLLAGSATLSVQPPPATAAGHAVTVGDDQFEDGTSSGTTTTIAAGDSVTWTWAGTHLHSVTADDASFDSDPPSGSRSSGTFSETFASAGSYAYYCRIHGAPGGLGMSGTIVVQAAAPTSTPTTPPAAATDTPEATDTPVTRTSTPDATETLAPAATATPQAATTATSNAPAAAPPPSTGGADAAAQLPRTGFGSDRDAPLLPFAMLSLGLTGAGLGMLVGFRSRRP